MNRYSLSFLALVAAIQPHPVDGQQPDSADPVGAFVSYMGNNPILVLYSGGETDRIVTTVNRSGDCIVNVARDGDMTTELLADLSAFSPEVTVDPFPSGVAFQVMAQVSSGEPEIRAHRVLEDGSERTLQWTSVSFTQNDRGVAETTASLLSAAIESCGGVQPSAEAAARLAAEQGEDPESQQLKEQCRSMVRGALRNPDSALFEGDPTIGRPTDGEVLVIGTVVASNALGGAVKRSYACQFEKVGDGYLPLGAPLIF